MALVRRTRLVRASALPGPPKRGAGQRPEVRRRPRGFGAGFALKHVDPGPFGPMDTMRLWRAAYQLLEESATEPRRPGKAGCFATGRAAAGSAHRRLLGLSLAHEGAP